MGLAGACKEGHIPGTTPLGYKRENKKLVINEYQAMIHGTININVASLQKYVEKYEKVEDGEDEEGNKKYKEVVATPNKVDVIVTVNGEQVEDRTVGEDTKNMQVGFDGKDTVTIKVIIDGSTKATKDINLNTTQSIVIE